MSNLPASTRHRPIGTSLFRTSWTVQPGCIKTSLVQLPNITISTQRRPPSPKCLWHNLLDTLHFQSNSPSNTNQFSHLPSFKHGKHHKELPQRSLHPTHHPQQHLLGPSYTRLHHLPRELLQCPPTYPPHQQYPAHLQVLSLHRPLPGRPLHC